MKRLLVIAYYFPPMGLSGVQRISKFVKYLPENGWAPTVLTVAPGGYFAFDPSLLDELEHPDISIVRSKALDPTKLFRKKKTVALPAESSRKILSNLSQFLFVPDNKIGWYWPAVKKANALHANQPFDCILATAPPYTCALIANKISKQCNVPFVLDFRDDWLENPRHTYPTFLHKKIHKSLEDRVFQRASSIITINDVIAEAMKNRNVANAAKIHVIKQGYDQSDFKDHSHDCDTEKFKLLYTGVFYDLQTPDYFLKGLAGFLAARPEAKNNLQAIFAGLIPANSKKLIEDLGLQDVVIQKGYIPHTQVVAELTAADVLWLTIGSGNGQEMISTGKLYEYIGARKPILGMVPDGAARNQLMAYDASFLVYPEDVDGIQQQLDKLYDLWQTHKLPRPNLEVVDALSRSNLTSQLAALLDQATYRE